MASDRNALWLRHHGAIRAYVEGLAQGFGTDPGRTWTGAEVDSLLRANLDLTDAQNDCFDDAPLADDDA